MTQPARKWGPVAGGPDDRWIAYHAMIGPRRVTRFALVILATVVVALGASFLVDGEYRAVAVVSGVGMLCVGAMLAWYTLRKMRAIEDERAYVAALPLPFPSYLETMREPRWRVARLDDYVRFEPRLFVTWEKPLQERAVERLGTLVGATVELDDPMTRTTLRPAGEIRDPWRWTRDVIDRLVMPLSLGSRPLSLELEVRRFIRQRESGGGAG